MKKIIETEPKEDLLLAMLAIIEPSLYFNLPTYRIEKLIWFS